LDPPKRSFKLEFTRSTVVLSLNRRFSNDSILHAA
jgi:hypothetical protein